LTPVIYTYMASIVGRRTPGAAAVEAEPVLDGRA
jgi:hypothetical protein